MNIARTMRRLATAAAVLAGISSIPWSGVRAQTVSSYTQDQADRGHKAYDFNCSRCHGLTLEGNGGTPALAGPAFRAHWFVGSPARFMAFISANMPRDNPGTLDPKTYADIAAYLMSRNRVRAGDADLPAEPEALSSLTLPPFQ